MTSRDPEKLGRYLGDVGRSLGLEGAVETGAVFKRWPEIVGEAIAAKARPTSLKGGVLRVCASTPAWATEIGYLAGRIREKANAIAGRELVSEVRVWTSPDQGAPSPTPPSADGRGAAVPPPRKGRFDDPGDALEAAREAWLRARSGPREKR